MNYWHPFIKDAVADAVAAGIGDSIAGYLVVGAVVLQADGITADSLEAVIQDAAVLGIFQVDGLAT